MECEQSNPLGGLLREKAPGPIELVGSEALGLPMARSLDLAVAGKSSLQIAVSSNICEGDVALELAPKPSAGIIEQAHWRVPDPVCRHGRG